MFSLYNSTISHEMLVPLKNMITVSEYMFKGFNLDKVKQNQANLIKISSQLLLA